MKYAANDVGTVAADDDDDAAEEVIGATPDPVRSGDNLQSLLDHLTFGIRDRDEVARAAAIFYWVIRGYVTPFPESLDCNDEACFNKLLAQTYWRPNIFEFLCRKSGMECRLVQGHARTLDSMLPPTQTRKSPSWNHTWTILKLPHSGWWVCDPLWASSYLLKQLTSLSSHKSSPIIQVATQPSPLSTLYFLMSPHIASYTHFPRNPAFQLISSAMEWTHFTQQPIVCPALASLLDRVETPESSGNCGQLRFVLTRNPGRQFCHSIQLLGEASGASEQNHMGVPFRAYTLLEVNAMEICLYMRLPRSGDYIITLFMQTYTEFEHQSASPGTKSDQYEAVFNYCLHWPTDNPAASVFYGASTVFCGASWPLFKRYSLSPVNHHRGVVELDFSPPAYVEICLNKDCSDVRLTARVRGSAASLPLSKCITETANTTYISELMDCEGVYIGYSQDWLIDDEDDLDDEATFSVRIPRYGEYAIEIFANNPKDGDTFVSVAQYMIDIKHHNSDRINQNRIK